MTTLSENLVNRVRKLTKPSTAAQAMQPFLEAVSNAMMAIDDRHEAFGKTQLGHVKIDIEGVGGDDVNINVRDNGIGLETDRYDAFCEIDTDFKSQRGGKGVGRLYWLDAFKNIEVKSRFRNGDGYSQRAFRFLLRREEQIEDLSPDFDEFGPNETGTIVYLSGLKQGPYVSEFPKQPKKIKDYVAAEFIADFLAGSSSHVTLSVTSKTENTISAKFPVDVVDLVVEGPEDLSAPADEDVPDLKIEGYLCEKKASQGLEGRHQLHLLGNKRTVETRNIDSLVGIGALKSGDHDDLAMHLVVGSEYLDDRVAESRTSFTVPASELDDIVKASVNQAREKLIADQLRAFDNERRLSFEAFLSEQPIFGLGDSEEIFASLPVGAKSHEDFVAKLALPRYRKERDREQRLTTIVQSLVSGDAVPEDFERIVLEAAKDVQESERSSLAHHAARRRVVLDLMNQLIRRLRGAIGDDKYHLESTLHSLIVPMRINSNDPSKAEHTAHDLWLLDERLAFASGFASDAPLKQVIKDDDSEIRPDILLWDHLYCLAPVGQQGGIEGVDDLEPITQVFIVEFKHPGRSGYAAGESVTRQITQYVDRIKAGKIEGFGRRDVSVSDDCRFYGMVVADFRGGLKDEISSWDYIHNRRGRERRLGGDHANVIIQAFEWDFVLSSAMTSNRALLDAAGLVQRGQTRFEKPESA